MPNLNVGLVMALVMVVPIFAAEQTNFYDEEGSYISTSDDGISTTLRVATYDTYCAFDGDYNNYSDLPQGATVYSCNGGCTRFSSSQFNIVNILPNGSYAYAYGPTANDSGSMNFVCTTSGWVACEPVWTSSGSYSYWTLATSLDLRKYTSSGYCEYNLWDYESLSFLDFNQFCNDPYYYASQGSSTSLEIPDSCSSSYDGCAPGYYLNGSSCTWCGSLDNGSYNPEWGESSQCTAYCDEGYGYKNSTKECVSGGSDEYHLYEYGGEEYDYRECPEYAECDGTYVYCPAGWYVYSAGDGEEPYCEQCPDGGMAGAQYALDSNGRITDCNGVSRSDGDYYYDWGQGYADETDCLWTDYRDTSPDTVCEKFMGTDSTGMYEFKYDDGYWYSCPYEGE